MTFFFSDELKEYMAKKKRDTILVELVICENSEIEAVELHFQLVDEGRARQFREKKGYGLVETECGKILLPRFKLDYKDEIHFGLKKILCFRMLSCDGIKLEK